MTQQSGNSFSSFKTSHDLKIIESSVLTQSSQRASSVLRLLLLSGLPGRQLLTSQHRGEQQLLGGRGLLSHLWLALAVLCSAAGSTEAGDPAPLRSGCCSVTEKHPSSKGSQKKWLELQRLPVLLCSHSQK